MDMVYELEAQQAAAAEAAPHITIITEVLGTSLRLVSASIANCCGGKEASGFVRFRYAASCTNQEITCQLHCHN